MGKQTLKKKGMKILISAIKTLGGSDGKESACSEGEMGAIPGLGRSCGGGNGNSLQSSCLGNPMDRQAWSATVTSQTRLRDKTTTAAKGPESVL